MAFSGLILKASPRQCVVPLARCAIRTSRNKNAAMFAFERQLRNCSSDVADSKHSVDANLYKALDFEYNLSKKMGKHAQVDKLTPLFPIEALGYYYHQGLCLHFRQTLFKDAEDWDDNEDVTLYANINSREKMDYYKKDENEAMSIENKKTPAIHVAFTVHKIDRDTYLRVHISVCAESFIIESIDDDWDGWSKYDELDDELRQALTEYLNVRGINRETMLLLLKIVDMENEKADFLALKHFKNAV